MRYLTNDYNKSEAYRYAYNCKNMSNNSVNVEASRFFKNPKITPWIERFQTNQQQTIQEQLNYDALKHFEELNEMKDAAMNCSDKYHNPNVSAAIKAVELKGKLAGLYKDERDNGIDGRSINVMGCISVDDKQLNFNVGEAIDDTASGNT